MHFIHGFILLLLIACSSNISRNLASENRLLKSGLETCDMNLRNCNIISQFLNGERNPSCGHEALACQSSDFPELLNKHTIVSKTLPQLHRLMNNVPNKKLFKLVTRYHKRAPKSQVGESAVGMFTKGKRLYPSGSGTLISPTKVLTALHVLHDVSENRPFDPKLISSRYKFRTDDGKEFKLKSFELISRPKLKEFAKNFRYPHPQVEFDYAYSIEDLVVVTLEEPAGIEVNYFHLFKGDYSSLMDKKFKMAGYPVFSVIVRQEQGMTEVDGGYVKYISKAHCEIGFIFKGLISSNCSPAGGISGGPIYFIEKRTGKRYIVGVLNSETKIVTKEYSNSMWSSFIGIDFGSQQKD